MGKISEIISIETQREDLAAMQKIHLWKEGSFFRAYNWSAWLIVNYCYTEEIRNKQVDRKPLSVTKRRFKNGDSTYCQIGFPVSSLKKFMPSVSLFNPVDDNHTEATLDLQEAWADQTIDTLKASYKAWEDSLEIEDKPQKTNDRETDVSSSSPLRIMQIVSQILSYPIERKSPIENTEFISRLKQQLAAVF